MSSNFNLDDFHFQEGERLLFYKPYGKTSFELVNKLRFWLSKYFGVKRLKVGHGGTLDPLAEGLLIICTGKATKELTDLQNATKWYDGTITLGASRPSYDMETLVDKTFPIDHITKELIEKTSLSFQGEQMQLPPVFSAIKKDGKTAYEEARKGNDIVLDPRKIVVYHLEWTRIELPEIDFRIHVSKGTYIRSFAHDFGTALGSGGYLSKLIRTKIGDHDLKDQLDLDLMVAELEKRVREQTGMKGPSRENFGKEIFAKK
jgi:tRNA pseudouridine55 synthase